MGLTAFSFFINMLLWMAGSTGILLAAMVSLKNRNPLIKQYMVTLGLWSLNMAQLLVFVYLNEFLGIDSPVINALLNDAGYAALGFFIYAIIKLTHGLFKISFTGWMRRIFAVLSFLIALPWILPTTMIELLKPFARLEMVKVVALYGGLYAQAFIFRRRIKQIESPDIRQLLVKAFWLQMLFFPLMMAEGALFYERSYPFIVSPATLFFFIVNMIWLHHVSRYLHLPELKLVDNSNRLAVFAEMYQVTPRELEVVVCILKGQSYKDVAESLFISHETVKSHVNKVYRKAGVQSKMALSHLIERCGD
jgi:DNA-binding CsgD family transcriptional regulator